MVECVVWVGVHELFDIDWEAVFEAELSFWVIVENFIEELRNSQPQIDEFLARGGYEHVEPAVNHVGKDIERLRDGGIFRLHLLHQIDNVVVEGLDDVL